MGPAVLHLACLLRHAPCPFTCLIPFQFRPVSRCWRCAARPGTRAAGFRQTGDAVALPLPTSGGAGVSQP
eukprot:5733575-Pyramimonas_sp.AAC.1